MSINYKCLAAVCGLVASVILFCALILLGMNVILSTWAGVLGGAVTGAGLATYWRKSLDLESSSEPPLSTSRHLAGVRRDL